ncbi:MAG: ERG4/ERG24 family protein, partial [Methylotetracoccus sp.]|nr:ERG4/ERG24 family protein [Methylotetracoccus sp.]
MNHNEQDRSGAVDAARQRYGFGLSWLILMLTLPPFVYYLWICATFYEGALVLPSGTPGWLEFWSHVSPPTGKAALIYAVWFLLQAVLQQYAPGRSVEGMPLPDGRRLEYRMNGMLSFLVTLGLVAGLLTLGWIDATLLYDELGPLLTVVNIFAFAFSGFLYVWGLRGAAWERPTGRPLYDYFMGTALNPRIGSFDFKLFCEARPGMILWLLLDLSSAAKQYQGTTNGDHSFVHTRIGYHSSGFFKNLLAPPVPCPSASHQDHAPVWQVTSPPRVRSTDARHSGRFGRQ